LPPVRFEKGEYDENLPPEPLEKIGAYLERAQLLGRRTAELHLALASEQEDPAFSPERFTPFYQRSLRQSMRNLAENVFETLRKGLPRVPKEIRPAARRLLKNEKRVQRRLRELLAGKINALRIRCHGDFHLGQVLFTGKDFVIIDFEGEPARPLSERRLKRCALRDVAGMLRSFHYAAYTPLEGQVAGAAVRPEDVPAVGKWADYWYSWVSHTYLQAYSHTVGDEPLLPQRTENMNRLLEAYLLDKAVYELGYELNNRPTWVAVPMRGIFQLILPSEGEET
jgi:maltose alpha-D-glucosyltransferase/alpha-amylase